MENQTTQNNQSEYLILHTSEKDEQLLINTMLKLGYTLVSNNTAFFTETYGTFNNGSGTVSSHTFTDIKLTFVRNRNIPNYEILNTYTHKILPLFKTKRELDSKTSIQYALFRGILYFLVLLLGIAALLVAGVFADFTELEFIYHSICASPIIAFIIALIRYKQRRKIFFPALSEICKEIHILSNEASEYVK